MSNLGGFGTPGIIHISCIKNRGIPSEIWLMISGGVIRAAKANKVCKLNFDILSIFLLKFYFV